MSNAPDGAQLSEDGHWWWDGAQWQPVDGTPQYSQDPSQEQSSQDQSSYDTSGGEANASHAEQPAHSEDPNDRQVAFDPTDFPTLMLYAQFDSFEDLARHIGIDTSTLQSDDDLPVS
jgi:hypothetical protein